MRFERVYGSFAGLVVCSLSLALGTVAGAQDSPDTTTTTSTTTSTAADGSTPTQGEVGALGVHTVTNGADAGAGSYRAAIVAANADAEPVTINFSAGLTVTLTTGDVIYTNTQPITLNGNGSTIDGSDAHQLLEAFGTTAITVNNLTMQNGETLGDGGAIEASNGDIILNSSTFSGNTAGDDGGATRTSSGDYTITNSTFTDNTAGGDGGATRTSSGDYTITNSTFTDNTAGGEGGGAYDSSGSYTITNSTFTGNTAGDDGGGARTSSGSYTITNSTFTGNTAGEDGGGARTSSGSYTITNSTFTGNTAGGEGGVMWTSSGGVTLTYATLADNTAPTGANIAADSLIAFGSVIANPLGGGANCDLDAATTSNGYNYSTDDSCDLAGTGDTQDGSDPLLGALASNGGPTQTRLPLTGSPLIDAIPTAACDPAVTTDQRGVSRPQQVGCDIGAVEVEAPELVVRFTG